MRKQWREADKLGRALIVAQWGVILLLLAACVCMGLRKMSWFWDWGPSAMKVLTGLFFLLSAAEEWRARRRVTAIISLCIAILDFVVVAMTWPN